MSLEHVDVRVRKCAGPFYYFKGTQSIMGKLKCLFVFTLHASQTWIKAM